ncbi:MAG: alpha/beta fold hydrolase [Cyclobacteriaceae bacterium]|nr:alpha/beta fold hydrolase [Cyclobacteriaceae bacterium]
MKKKKNNIPLIIRVVQTAFPVLERWAPFLADRVFRLVFYVPARYPVPAKEKDFAATGRNIEVLVNGKTIRGQEWGDASKPYVLLVAGWAGRATQFRRFVPPLMQMGYRVIGPDGPAHGQSDGIKTSIMEYDTMLQKIFEKFGQPTAIITHSFGGAAVLYAAMNGLPVDKLVNIASPSIADEILKTYLRAINGSWKSAERFKKFVIKKTGKSFEEFTALHAVQHLPKPVDLLMIMDEEDADVVFRNAIELMKAYPLAQLYKTSGLGHTRILKDDQVIAKALEFIGH